MKTAKLLKIKKKKTFNKTINKSTLPLQIVNTDIVGYKYYNNIYRWLQEKMLVLFTET